jgi:hypothetical protein
MSPLRALIRRLAAVATSGALVAGMLTLGFAATQLATSQPAGAAIQAADCTFNGVSNPVVNGALVPFDLGGTVTPGTTTVTIACSGLPTTATSIAIVVASPLAGFIVPADQSLTAQENLLMGSPVLVSTTCSSTACSYGPASFTIPSQTTAANTDGTCPPSAAQVQVGLTNCALTVADTSGDEFGLTFLNYPNQPTPAAPTVSVSQSDVQLGDQVTLSGSGFWGDPEGTGAANTTFGSGTDTCAAVSGVPGVTVSVTDSASHTASLTTNAVQIPVDCYKLGSGTNGAGGTLSGGFFSATNEDLPTSGLVAGTLTYSVAEPNVAPFNDPPYDTATGSCSPTPCTAPTPSPTNPPNPAAAIGAGTDTLLGAPTLTVSPTSGGTGTVVSITGTNWDPEGSAVTVKFTTACATCSGPNTTTITVSSTGAISGSIQITAESGTGPGEATGSNPLVGTQTGFNTSLTFTAQAAFTVTALSSTCSISPPSSDTESSESEPSCTINQVISTTVTGTALTISEPSTTVTLTPVTLGLGNGTNNQQFENATGNLQTVTVSDDRGTLDGWIVTAELETDFNNSTATGNAADNVIPADFLTWVPTVALETPGSIPGANQNTPFCPSNSSGTCVGPSGLPAAASVTSPAILGGTLPAGHNGAGSDTGTGGTATIPAEVFAGPTAVLNSEKSPSPTPAVLCEAPEGGGGGGFVCNASLSLAVPPYVAAGTYSSTMDIVVTGL